MTQIVCFSESKWSADPKRTQHLMRLLGNVEIIYFEFTVVDSLTNALRRSTEESAREPRPGVSVLRVPPIYYLDSGTSIPEKWTQRRAAQFISQEVGARSLRDVLLWVATPVGAHFMDIIPQRTLIYDCAESWERYPTQLESRLACEADMVFAASVNLREHVAPCNQHVYLLPNGVNYDLYARGASEDTPLDQAVIGLRRPVFAYFGDVKRSVRFEPLLYAAQNNPEWTFLIVGRERNNVALADLKKCRNVHFLGYRAPSEVPGCLAGCDACIELQHNDISDEDVLTERMLMYFAAEKPVADMYPRRYVPEFPDVVYGGQTEEEFEHACLQAGNELGQRKRQLRREYARMADWNLRATALQSILHENGVL